MNRDRYFDPDPQVRSIARRLSASVESLPLLCPHSHVEPALFADPGARFGNPVELFILPDHYIYRMLTSQGIALERLGIQPLEGREGGEVEGNPRRAWQTFADNFHLFAGTPTGTWLGEELAGVFGIEEKLTTASAVRIYDRLEELLGQAEYSPRALYKRFRIQTLCTSDAASDPLEDHAELRASFAGADIRPTFRPDAVLTLDAPGWRASLGELEAACGMEIGTQAAFVRALEERRAFFKRMGATASDHAVLSPFTCRLEEGEVEDIFQRARRGEGTPSEAAAFSGHMLVEMARMSVEDGLVMQLHPGALRNHNPAVFARFGADRGADIPVRTEFTRNLRPLLEAFGNDTRLSLIVFTLDEATLSRELAPLAGHYPALKIGPPWWFFDSLGGMRRYFDAVMETAGIFNTAGFNDDTRAFCSIPARHTVWRRAACNWLAGMVARHIVDEDEAGSMAYELAYGLAAKAYRMDEAPARRHQANG